MYRQRPLFEGDEPEVSAEQVERRVTDWLGRLDRLYGAIRAWAVANGWAAVADDPVPMHEEMMLRADAPARQQPTLLLHSPHGAIVRFKPKALWVIGANGRIDIYAPKGVFALLDGAEPFEAPVWQLFRVGKGEGKPFKPAQIAEMI